MNMFFIFTQGTLQRQVKCQVWNVPRLPNLHRQDEKPKEEKEAGIQDQEEWEWVSAQSGFALAKAGDTNGRGVGLFW